MPRMGLIILAFTACAAAGAAQAAPVVIDTTPSWDSTSAVYPWGHNNVTETYGQSVTAPAQASSLKSFSFIIQDVNDYMGVGVPGPITYQAYVYQWDPLAQHITGSALWQSPVLQTPGTDTGAFVTTSFTTPGTAVTPGSQYMLFLTTNGVPTQTDGNTAWADTFADVYSGGAFRFVNDPSFGTLATTAWSDSSTFGSGAGDDLAFTATFGVPEPASIALLGVAFAGLGFLRRRT